MNGTKMSRAREDIILSQVLIKQRPHMQYAARMKANVTARPQIMRSSSAAFLTHCVMQIASTAIMKSEIRICHL